MSLPIRLILVGSNGKMGRMVKECLQDSSSIELVTEVKSKLTLEEFNQVLKESKANVLLDFTHPESALSHAQLAFENKIAPIIGTSGLDLNSIKKLKELSEQYQTPGMWVPNFSLTAVLLMHCAEIIAQWIPDVQIVEYHHNQKADAPSGTAVNTAQKISQIKKDSLKNSKKIVETYPGSLGASVEGIQVHAVRLIGLMAHQEVLFGSFGELLTLRYDNYDRKSYFKGIELSILKIGEKKEFLIGLESLLF